MENRKDRDSKGRFLKGAKSPSPGRPPRRVEEQYLAATIGGCSLDEWSAIVAKAVEQATEGDRFARDFLARYLLPEQALKLVFGAQEESSADVVFEVTIPAPRIGPHGSQQVGQIIEGESDASISS